FHSLQVSLQRIQVPGPEAPEGSEPCVEFHERLRSQAVKAALRLDAGFHESRLPQHAQVLGHGWLRQTKLAFELSHGALGGEQEAENGPAVGLRDDLERRLHGGEYS